MVRVSLPTGVLRAWTGAGEAEVQEPPEINGGDQVTATYAGTAKLASRLSQTPRFALQGAKLGAAPIVGRPVEVWLAGYVNGAWRSLLVQHVGLLDRPAIEDGELRFEVRRPDVALPTRRWSGDNYDPGAEEPDTIFAQLKALRKGIRNALTEPPPFREDSRYDGLALSLRPWEASPTGATSKAAAAGTTPQALIAGPAPVVAVRDTRSGVRVDTGRTGRDVTLPRGW